jgi:hypothetical protein
MAIASFTSYLLLRSKESQQGSPADTYLHGGDDGVDNRVVFRECVLFRV